MSPTDQPPTRTLAPQDTGEPTRKTKSAMLGAGLGTAISTIVTWALQTYTNVEIPAPVQVAVATIITVGFAYFTREYDS